MQKVLVRRRERQLDLFQPDPKVRSSLGIPAEARRKVTPLLARMFQEYQVHLLANERGKEVGDE
jgi:hypothetical protein